MPSLDQTFAELTCHVTRQPELTAQLNEIGGTTATQSTLCWWGAAACSQSQYFNFWGEVILGRQRDGNYVLGVYGLVICTLLNAFYHVAQNGPNTRHLHHASVHLHTADLVVTCKDVCSAYSGAPGPTGGQGFAVSVQAIAAVKHIAVIPRCAPNLRRIAHHESAALAAGPSWAPSAHSTPR
jgi:hypothetical protein